MKLNDTAYFCYDIVTISGINDIDKKVNEVKSTTIKGAITYSLYIEDSLYPINDINQNIYNRLMTVYNQVKKSRFYNNRIYKIFTKYWDDTFENPNNLENNIIFLQEVIEKLNEIENTQIDNIYIFAR